ncbi:MAG TPA: nuclear transport factor 2 family protein [Propionicimonas sp.]|nr:nuclear transport factor 2 family protein [Propionicimonas sp.]
MDHGTAKDWLDRYVAAWVSYDPAAIGDLFTEDVSYRYHPSDQPTVGRDAVVASWLGESTAQEASTRDAPGTYQAAYAPVAIEGDVLVAIGTSTYYTAPGGQVDTVNDNCVLMRFDASGKCSDFTEYYVKRSS